MQQQSSYVSADENKLSEVKTVEISQEELASRYKMPLVFSHQSLKTSLVQLEPLVQAHADALFEAAKSPNLWEWVYPNRYHNLDSTNEWIRESLSLASEGKHSPFVIIDRQSQKIVGTTRLILLDSVHRSVEIGYTFICPQFQRTYVNTHAKFLLLQYAFEQLNVIRVVFHTHENNQRSRNAIARLGAQFEGIQRYHRLFENGSFRNSAVYSVTWQNWLSIEQNLKSQLIERPTKEIDEG